MNSHQLINEHLAPQRLV